MIPKGDRHQHSRNKKANGTPGAVARPECGMHGDEADRGHAPEQETRPKVGCVKSGDALRQAARCRQEICQRHCGREQSARRRRPEYRKGKRCRQKQNMPTPADPTGGDGRLDQKCGANVITAPRSAPPRPGQGHLKRGSNRNSENPRMRNRVSKGTRCRPARSRRRQVEAHALFRLPAPCRSVDGSSFQ